jgi:TolB-like protein
MSLALAALLLAAQPSSSAPLQVLVLEPKVVNVDASRAARYQRLLVQALSRAQGLSVVASSDVARFAELGAAQQASSCDADACLAEIAGALGADLVVFGEVGKLGDRALVQLSLFDQKQGGIIARATDEGQSVDELAGRVDHVAKELVRPLRERGVSFSDEGGALKTTGIVLVGVGAAAAVVGGAGLVAGAVVVPSDAYDTSLRRGFQAAGPALVGTLVVGVVVAAAGGVLWAVD